MVSPNWINEPASADLVFASERRHNIYDHSEVTVNNTTLSFFDTIALSFLTTKLYLLLLLIIVTYSYKLQGTVT